MSRGFITLVAVGYIALISLVTLGGTYTFYKINVLENENKRINSELNAQKLEDEVKEVITADIQLSHPHSATNTRPLTTSSIEKSSSTEIDHDSTVEKSVQPQIDKVTGASSKDLIETIDVWIKKSESFSDSLNEYIATIDYYSGTASKSNKALKTLIDTETDAYLLSEWKYLSSVTGSVINISASLKSGTELKGSVSNLTNSVNNYTEGLIEKKNGIPEYYRNDEMLKADFLKLIDYQYDSYGKVLDQIHNAQMEYLGLIQHAMTKISETEPDIRSYMSRERISNDTFSSSPIYQTVTTPQIQMPKTTYCNTHETGALNHYSITCNTY